MNERTLIRIMKFTILAASLYLGFVAIQAISIVMELRKAEQQEFEPAAPENEYPQDPEKVFKIAVFGESSANGYTVGCSFADILKKEIMAKGQPVYLRNYASDGATFDQHQAEIAKIVLPYYDLTVIYSGHNEIWNPTYDYGGLDVYGGEVPNNWSAQSSVDWFRKQQEDGTLFKGREDSPPKYEKPKLADTVKPKNLKKLSNRFKFKIGGKKQQPPPPTTSKKVVPLPMIDELDDAYRADLIELKELAEKNGKDIILCTVASHLMWPPFFSKQKDGLTLDEKTKFELSFESAKRLLEKEKFEEAKESILQSLQYDAAHAEANFILGSICLHEKDFANAWIYLERAKDEDGWPIRVLSGVNNAIRDVFGPVGKMVDHEKQVLEQIEKGKSFDDLFNDLQHPNFYQQVMIAKEVLQAIPSFDNKRKAVRKLEKALKNKDALLALQQEYGVNEPQMLRNYELNFRWLVGVLSYAHNPKKYYQAMENAWNRYYDRDSTTDQDKLKHAFGQALLGSYLGRIDREKIVNSIESLKKDAPEMYETIVKEGLTGISIEQLNRHLKAEYDLELVTQTSEPS